MDPFALGWPELYVLTDDPRAKGLPVEAGGRRWVWTRAEAEACLSERDPDRAARNAVAHGEYTDVLLLECLNGADAVATGFIASLEEFPAPRRPQHAALFDAVRFVIARSEAKDALLARLDALLPATERVLKYDRRNAALVAYVGDHDVKRRAFDRWYLVDEAEAQSYFLATAGRLPGPEIEAAIAEGARVCLVPDEACAWLVARGLPVPPIPEAPPPADLDTFVRGEADEFGYVFLPRAAAAQLRGEDDHTALTEGVDPISLEPNAVRAYGANGILFCRTYEVAWCRTSDGAFVTYGSDEDGMRAACASAAERRWLPLTTVDGPLVGLPAGLTLAEATPFELPLPPGSYAVKTAIQTEELVPLLWLRKI